MAKLTDAIKDLILNPVKEGAWTAQLGWIATVREDGAPNIGPKRSCRIYDDATLVYLESEGETELVKYLREVALPHATKRFGMIHDRYSPGCA